MPLDATREVDAFGFTADPSAYVPRLALEAALAELSELIGKTPACAALTGEAGLGKTLVLHVLRERLAGAFECLYVPFPRLAPSDFWAWVAVATGLGSGDDDRGAVLGRARSLAADGSGLVLLVDDAAALPAETRSELIAACETTGLSVVLAFDSEDLAQLGGLPAHVRRIDLGPPMSLVETRSYVQARLRQLDPDGTIGARLDARRLAEMHEASGGIPARLHALFDAWLRGSAAQPSPSQAVEQGPAESETLEGSNPRLEPAAVPEPADERIVLPALPVALRALLAQLQRPPVQLAVATIFVLLIGGFWYFALQRGGNVSSVGVPVEPFQVPRREPVPPSPVAEPAPAIATPTEPAEEPERAPAEPGASAPKPPPPVAARPPATVGRAAEHSPPLAERTPAPDPAQTEPAVRIVSARFPDEHVPAALEATSLAPPPPGPRLNVNAVPWAEIHVDGRPVGETPLGELPVAPGAHVVSAKLPDGRVLERNVEAGNDDVYVVF